MHKCPLDKCPLDKCQSLPNNGDDKTNAGGWGVDAPDEEVTVAEDAEDADPTLPIDQEKVVISYSHSYSL